MRKRQIKKNRRGCSGKQYECTATYIIDGLLHYTYDTLSGVPKTVVFNDGKLRSQNVHLISLLDETCGAIDSPDGQMVSLAYKRTSKYRLKIPEFKTLQDYHNFKYSTPC